jgi:hypothetical protein
VPCWHAIESTPHIATRAAVFQCLCSPRIDHPGTSFFIRTGPFPPMQLRSSRLVSVSQIQFFTPLLLCRLLRRSQSSNRFREQTSQRSWVLDRIVGPRHCSGYLFCGRTGDRDDGFVRCQWRSQSDPQAHSILGYLFPFCLPRRVESGWFHYTQKQSGHETA